MIGFDCLYRVEFVKVDCSFVIILMLFVISFDVGICFLFFIINIWEIFFGFLDMVLSKVIFGFRMLFIIFRYEILLINGLVIVLNIKV